MVSSVNIHGVLYSSKLGPKKDAPISVDTTQDKIQRIRDQRFSDPHSNISLRESHQVAPGFSDNINDTFIDITVIQQIVSSDDALDTVMSRTQGESAGLAGSSVLYTGAGICRMHHAAKQSAEAHRHGDGLNLATRSTQFLQGTVQTTIGLVQTASKIIESSPLTGLQKVTSILGIISKVGLAGMMAIFTIASVFQFAKLKTVYNSIKDGLKDLTTREKKIVAFKTLSKTLVVTSDDRKKVFEEIFNGKEPWYKKSTASVIAEKYFPGDKDKKQLLENLFKGTKSAVDIELSSFNAQIKDADITLSPEEEADFNTMLASLPTTNPGKWFPNLAKLLYKTGIENEAERKHTVFRDSFGIDVLLAVEQFNKDNENIDDCDGSKIDEITKILSAAKTNITKNLACSFLAVVGITIGAIALIIAYFASHGIFPLIELAVTSVISAVSVGYNVYRLFKVFQDPHISPENKSLIISSSIGSVLLTGITIGCSQLGSPLVGTIAVAAAWIFLGLYTTYVWVKTSSSKDKDSQEEQHPISAREVGTESGYASGAQAALLVEDVEEDPYGAVLNPTTAVVT